MRRVMIVESLNSAALTRVIDTVAVNFTEVITNHLSVSESLTYLNVL